MKILEKFVKYKKKILLILAILLFCLRNEIYFYFYSKFWFEKDFVFKHEPKIFYKLSLNSPCFCRPEIRIEKNLNNYDIYKNESYSYSIKVNSFTSIQLTCELYSSIYRGPSTRVISFSLYGKNKFYSNLLKKLVEQIKKMYPNWLIRIYHDESIDKNLKCEMECLWNEKENNFYDIVDFCNVEQIADGLEKINLSYMHAMSWRWLPIGDDFVDFWSSRDSDSEIFQREIDSVNVWLNSNTIFHVMRGNF